MAKDIAIDLGTANTRIYLRGKGLVVDEPTAIAINTKQDRVVAVGREAAVMYGRVPQNISVIMPVNGGVVGDFDAAARMVQEFIKMAMAQSYFGRPVARLGFRRGMTEVEEMALKELAEASGIKKHELLSSVAASAVGINLKIVAATACMVADLGAGVSEVAVFSMGDITASGMIRCAGNALTDAIIPHIKKEYGVLIGRGMAEEVKMTIGSALPKVQDEYMEVRGRDLYTGLPKNIQVSSEEIREAMDDTVKQIVGLIKKVLEQLPPEQLSDILDDGIYLTGGTALLNGLDRRIALDTGVSVTVAESPTSSVIAGLGRCIDNETVRRQPAFYNRSVGI